MPRVKKPDIKPTTMRIDPALLKRAAAVGRNKYQRSRSWLIAKYITDGLARDERAVPKIIPAPEGAFA